MPEDLAQLLEANRRAAVGFDRGEQRRRPARPIAVLTCLDGRIDPLAMLGLAPGDANILRNAGARVTDDVIRSLLVSGWLLGTRLFLVVHHTDCGLESPGGDEEVRTAIAAAGGDAAGVDLASFPSVEVAVAQDVARLLAEARFPADIEVRGCVYDVRTGLIREVPEPPAGLSR